MKDNTISASLAIMEYAALMSVFIAKKAVYNSAAEQESHLRALRSQNEEEISHTGDAYVALTKMIERAEMQKISALRELKDTAILFLETVERLEAETSIRPNADYVAQAQHAIRKMA